MSRDMLTIGSTMRIPLLYRVSIAGTSSTEQPPLKDKSIWSDQEKKIQKIDRLARSLLIQGLPNDIYSLIDSNKTAKDLWDALARHKLVINDLKKCGYSEDNCELNLKFLNNLQPEWKQYATMMRQNKNLMDINIDALYNIRKQNQGDVNDVMGLKKKTVMVTSDPVALIPEKTKVSKRKEKVVVSSDSEGSDADDFSKLKKITALLAKAFNRRKFYSKPTNHNLKTSSTSQSANKKQEYVKSDDKKVEKKDDEKKQDMSKVKCYNCKKEGHFKKDCKKAKVKDYEYYKTKMLPAKKDKEEQVLLAEDHAWMESSKASSSSADDKISEVSYYLSESESESEYETSEYYDNTTTYEQYAKLEAERYEYMIRYSAYFDNDKQHRKQIADQEVLARENKIEFAYDYGNLNASYVNEKINFFDDYFQEIINPDFEKIDSSFQQTSLLKPYVPTMILEKIIIDLEDEVVSSQVKKLFLKQKIKVKMIEKVYDSEENPNVISPGLFKLSVSQSVSPISVTKTSCASNGVENLDTLSSVRRPKPRGVMWMKKESSSTVKADLSYVNHSNLNKNVKRYSRKKLMACNNSDTRNAFVCNNARNALCNARMNASVDVNDLFVFDNIVQICLWIIHSGCSKHMMGSCALLTNFVEKFLGTVCFGNNDFAVIAGYGDAGLEVAFQKSTCFFRTEDGVDLLTGDRSSNFYTIALNEVASNSLACLLAKDSSSQSWLWHQRLSHLNFATINKLVKNNLVQGLPKMKVEKDHLCFACEQGKIHRKRHKSKTDFASNKPLYLLHMDLCGPMRVESINEKRYVLVVVDDYSRYTWRVRTDNGMEFKNKTLAKFFDDVEMASKQFNLEPDLSNLNKTEKSSNLSVSQVSETLKKDLFQKFYYEYFDASKIMKSSTMNVETSNIEIPSNEEEFFHESFESFQEESSSSSLNDDVHQSVEKVMVPLSNTQSILNNMVSNIDEASTSHNVFNKRLEDAYFDATLRDVDSVSAMKEELDQFARLKFGYSKQRKLVEVGYSQQEGIDYDEMFTLVTRIKSIHLFLAYAAHKDFTVFQMDVKTTFLNGILKEEVYVGQPLGFVSKQYPDHVYALDKALYGLKQAPRAWKQIADQQVLYDKINVQLVELDKHVRDLKNTVLEKDFKISELEECVRNKDLEIEKCSATPGEIPEA
nr:hypothetical protein [Tanacetum cinerariifolium]